jgi:hypothetical protein
LSDLLLKELPIHWQIQTGRKGPAVKLILWSQPTPILQRFVNLLSHKITQTDQTENDPTVNEKSDVMTPNAHLHFSFLIDNRK